MKKIEKLRDSAVDQALLAKAYMAALIKKNETTDSERENLARHPLKDKFLEMGQSIRTFYFHILEGRLASKLEEERMSGDFTKLMEAGEDASTGNVETLWQKVRTKVNPDEAVTDWLKSKVLADRVKQHPEFLNAAKEFAVKYLRYLFVRRLNGEAVETTGGDSKPL